MTNNWVGVIENGFYRPEVQRNVYGVRFLDHKNSYARYHELDLQPAAVAPITSTP